MFGFTESSTVNRYPPAGNKAVKDNALYTAQDFFIFLGLEEAIQSQQFYGDFFYSFKRRTYRTFNLVTV